ncbi:DUF2911 domain-containing protein [Flavilitoribacter nigricans]|uniref:DUF2911 domain-containing protein n=1 Tax=Flavilitoribacter nigricans (strain ATCC 23147 / DSM 23189 / NBRC 102662 / NCIMB 1420 / SS-2) TaxID=1122177 RepID=A0A2D0N7F9_FLAN2|nr:DUF2911 domain-containing protein [Flavilitoribacter nigricans]PHN04407.1 hypothetical protein CRP01_20575 [Flavilitoribacter nigricans DSM 23189 = NBRC 102662]
MFKFLKWTFYIVAGFALLLFVGFKVLQLQTKRYSPEDTVTYKAAGNELMVYYNRPYKKERAIFGSLVPFGEVWRTGANEATTFSTEDRITFGGKKLRAGTYTLWTVPGPDSWKVIINDRQYTWGVTTDGIASRDPAADVLEVDVPVEKTKREVEQFTINFVGSGRKPDLVLSWDETQISIPINW